MSTKKPKASTISLESRKKRSANSTSFKPGNKYRFKEGTSGNSGGKPKAHRLLSRTLRAMLSDPAPLQVAQAFGLKGRNASWAMCISARLCREAVSGDLDAARLIGVLTEGTPRAALDPLALDDFDATATPLLQVVFVDANGNGEPAAGVVIEAREPRELPTAVVD